MTAGDIEQAIRALEEDPRLAHQIRVHRGAYYSIASAIQRFAPKGARILDFGAGPADKTAILQLLGYRCTAIDDFQNPIHFTGEFRSMLKDLASRTGMEVLELDGALPFEPDSFDVVMLNDVLEHLHDPPRELLNDLVNLLREDGLLLVTVPNAVNLRKRFDVIRGRTNHPRFDTYYWYPGPWRGHVREYTRRDLELLAHYLDLEVLELTGCHHMLHVLGSVQRAIYRIATTLAPDSRDSWRFVARKKQGWSPSLEPPPGILDEILAYCNR